MTLRAGRPGKSFLRFFGDFGARGCGDSCIWGLQSQRLHFIASSSQSSRLEGLKETFGLWRPQRSPTYGPPEQSCHGKFRKIGNFGRGEKTPTPKISALLRERAVLLRANFVLTKDRKQPYYGHFCGKMHREGSCSKAAGGP